MRYDTATITTMKSTDTKGVSGTWKVTTLVFALALFASLFVALATANPAEAHSGYPYHKDALADCNATSIRAKAPPSDVRSWVYSREQVYWMAELQKYNGSQWVVYSNSRVSRGIATNSGLAPWYTLDSGYPYYIKRAVNWIYLDNNNPAETALFSNLGRGYYRVVQKMNWEPYPNSVHRYYQNFQGNYQNCYIG